MSDLIKQIDHELDAWPRTSTLCKTLNDCKAEIERLSKPYVPMTDDELDDWLQDNPNCVLSDYETATIARYNEQRGVK